MSRWSVRWRSIPFYGYLFYSYQNYMIFYEQVERTLEIENAADDEKKKTETEKESPKYFDDIESSLMPWLENKSYTNPDLPYKTWRKRSAPTGPT